MTNIVEILLELAFGFGVPLQHVQLPHLDTTISRGATGVCVQTMDPGVVHWPHQPSSCDSSVADNYSALLTQELMSLSRT